MKAELKRQEIETAAEVEIIRDIEFAHPGINPLLLDVYLPVGKVDLKPVIIWLHGGGFKFGDRRLAPNLSRYYAEKGYAMVSIDYRLSEEVIFPAAIEDVKTAIRWVRTFADQYGFDSNRIGLWGSSAGGNLASLSATSGPRMFEDEDSEYQGISSQVQAVAVGYGPNDFLQIDDERDKITGIVEEDPESIQIPKDARSADPDSFESLYLGAPINTCPDKVKQANPITYVKDGMPPFLLMHGLSDIAVPAHQSELLYRALANYENNDVSFYLIEGLGHGFLNRNDFDKVPRDATLKIKVSGEAEVVHYNQRLTFDTIEAFFRKHLCE